MATANPNLPAPPPAEQTSVVKVISSGTPYGNNAPVLPAGICWPDWR